MKVILYKICEESVEYRLATEVNNLIAAGWQPQGGVSVATEEWTTGNGDYQRHMTYSQAMVRYAAE